MKPRNPSGEVRGVLKPGGGFGTDLVSCEDDPTQEGCDGTPPTQVPSGPSVDLGFDCDPGTFYLITQADDKDGDGLRESCELSMAMAFEPELLFEAQEIHQGREPHFIVEQKDGYVNIAYLLSYYYDGGAVSHNGDSEFLLYKIRNVGGTRWYLETIATSAHYGAGYYQDWSEVRPWSSYYFTASTRARIYVSRSHHANYHSQSRCSQHLGDICSAAPSDGGFVQMAGRGYNFVSGLRLDNNIGNTFHRLVIDPSSSFGAVPGPQTDCTYADRPTSTGYECYLSGSQFSGQFAGWIGSGGTTSYGAILTTLGFQLGYHWY